MSQVQAHDKSLCTKRLSCPILIFAQLLNQHSSCNMLALTSRQGLDTRINQRFALVSCFQIRVNLFSSAVHRGILRYGWHETCVLVRCWSLTQTFPICSMSATDGVCGCGWLQVRQQNMPRPPIPALPQGKGREKEGGRGERTADLYGMQPPERRFQSLRED